MVWLTGFAVAALAAGAVACKGNSEAATSSADKRDLDECRSRLDDRDTLISRLEQENADLKLGEIKVVVEGDVLTVSGADDNNGNSGRPGGPGGNANDTKLYEAFVAEVRESRGAIKKCYQNALKNNTALQARTVPLQIIVDVKRTGKVTNPRFRPGISENFNQCMGGVTGNWQLPGFQGRPVSFQTTVTLTPE